MKKIFFSLLFVVFCFEVSSASFITHAIAYKMGQNSIDQEKIKENENEYEYENKISTTNIHYSNLGQNIIYNMSYFKRVKNFLKVYSMRTERFQEKSFEDIFNKTVTDSNKLKIISIEIDEINHPNELIYLYTNKENIGTDFVSIILTVLGGLFACFLCFKFLQAILS
jgi:hypothetical protein